MKECSKCSKKVSKKVEDFSLDKYKAVLCFECQQKSAKGETTQPQQEQEPITKDHLIVRQTCIKAAAELASMKQHDWKELAEEMEAWVLR